MLRLLLRSQLDMWSLKLGFHPVQEGYDGGTLPKQAPQRSHHAMASYSEEYVAYR